MEEPLFRVMSQVAEKRIAAQLHSKVAIVPEQLAKELLDEFSQFLRFEQCMEALQRRIEIHISKIIDRHPQRCSHQ